KTFLLKSVATATVNGPAPAGPSGSLNVCDRGAGAPLGPTGPPSVVGLNETNRVSITVPAALISWTRSVQDPLVARFPVLRSFQVTVIVPPDAGCAGATASSVTFRSG